VAALTARGTRARRTAGELLLTVGGGVDVDAVLAAAHAAGGKVIAVTPRHETLEDLFLRRVADQGAREVLR
jgi:hypothetical protein